METNIEKVEKTTWLYVIKLEQDRIFLYDTHSTNEFEVFVYSHLKYDYLKKYKPVDIMEIFLIEDHIEILYYLKKYMAAYGIDYVRGKPYTNEFLTKQEIQLLENEFMFINEENEEKDSHIKEFLSIYGNEKLPDIENEIAKLQNIIKSYKSDLENFDRLKWINESVLYDIEWIRKLCCLSNTRPYKYMYKELSYKKYTAMIERIKKVAALYFEFSISDNTGYENTVFLKHPDFIFDSFIFLSYTTSSVIVKDNIGDGSSRVNNKVDDLCEAFIIMVNTLINRKMEYKFAIESYGKDTEWKLERAIYFLNNYNKYII
jgi:hypothetical protein